ncbi:MAG: leucine-rich repeat domain-containing protein [Erysipelotrichaceae bacterium]|nr:leucine-rich repeat domain-containing protein [Erysipelotrichaceae bacterium]
MGEYNYKLADNDTYMLMHYEGDDVNVVVPNTFYGKPVTLMYDSLYAHHSEIETITIPDTITCIGGHIFDGLDQLKSLELPPHLMDLMQYAFVRCGVEEVNVPDEVRLILPYTFTECASLKTIRLGKGVKRIYGKAFSSLPELTDLYIPTGTKVSEVAIDHCPKVQIHYY